MGIIFSRSQIFLRKPIEGDTGFSMSGLGQNILKIAIYLEVRKPQISVAKHRKQSPRKEKQAQRGFENRDLFGGRKLQVNRNP